MGRGAFFYRSFRTLPAPGKNLLVVAPFHTTRGPLSLPYGRDKVMQQTTKYQFKLIEGTDDFSPTPLNDNMEAVESQLSALETSLAGLADNLGTAGHNCRIATGSYVGTGPVGEDHPTSLTFPFEPVWVLIANDTGNSFSQSLLMRPLTVATSTHNSSRMTVTWSGKTVSWYVQSGQINEGLGQNNCQGYTYQYIALGYDE